MPKTSRYLITTADERSWVFDRPVLFLGEWCRRYDRKHVWLAMDAESAAPYGIRGEQKKKDVAYVQELSGQLLIELSNALNAFHNTKHSLRYWQIVLGHWLQRYVSVAFNRYVTLQQSLKSHDVAGTTVFDSTNYSLAVSDSLTFVWAINDDTWNHVFYSKILSFLGDVETEVDFLSLRGVGGFSREINTKAARVSKVKKIVQNIAQNILPKFRRNNDAFIISSYLPRREEVKLQLSLGQCPQLWRSPVLKSILPDSGKRREFKLDTENSQGFEKFVRLQLSEVIPTCYLEGYEQLVHHVGSVPWPSKPKFIFTSNNFDTDEVFKAWAGSKVEEGVRYFTGQHGNNFGTLQGSQNWPEQVNSDKFFTWGWDNGNSKNIPAFIFKTAGRKHGDYKASGGLLLMEFPPALRLGPEDNYFNFATYQEEQFRFVEALSAPIQQKLTVRFHSSDRKFDWCSEKRWFDRSPHTHIETGEANIRELISQSRLVVHSYDSTGILETLELNIPTMCFWQGGLEHLLASAKPYYELLRAANILAETPEQAAEMITLHWNDISGWWNSRKVQDARKAFCEQYARTEKRPIRTMRRLLMTHANKGTLNESVPKNSRY